MVKAWMRVLEGWGDEVCWRLGRYAVMQYLDAEGLARDVGPHSPCLRFHALWFGRISKNRLAEVRWSSTLMMASSSMCPRSADRFKEH